MTNFNEQQLEVSSTIYYNSNKYHLLYYYNHFANWIPDNLSNPNNENTTSENINKVIAFHQKKKITDNVKVL